MVFNASMNMANINLNIHCISTQEELQSLAIEESLDMAFDFEDPSALIPGSNKSVAYHIRPSYNKFTITNWVNYANTTHQAPNAMASSLAYMFTPLQHFMDSLISFAGPLTFKNARHAPECVQACPLDRLLTETDSPYLTPVPHRGKQNEPMYVKYVAQKVAEIKGLSEEEVCTQIEKNFLSLF